MKPRLFAKATMGSRDLMLGSTLIEMNILLFDTDSRVFNTSPAQTKHLKSVLKVQVGDSVRCGILDSCLFNGKVVDRQSRTYTIELVEKLAPPAQSPVHLIVGTCRPRMLHRILHLTGEFGISKIWLVPTRLSEKSYLQSESYSSDAIRERLVQGLEQGNGVFLPEFQVFNREILSLESELSGLSKSARYVLDGNSDVSSDIGSPGEVVFALGPERGWVKDELEMFDSLGFSKLKLSSRVLRLETAVAAVLGIYDWSTPCVE